MLADPIDDPAGTTPEALLDEYAEELAAVLDAVGADHVREDPSVRADVVDAIESGDVEDVDLREAAAVLALRPDSPDAATLLAEAREALLLSMSIAMLTVDRIAADLPDDLDPKEVQGKVEGRHPTSVGEYARLRHYVASRT